MCCNTILFSYIIILSETGYSKYAWKVMGGRGSNSRGFKPIVGPKHCPSDSYDFQFWHLLLGS